jgi:hypothetical protein
MVFNSLLGLTAHAKARRRCLHGQRKVGSRKWAALETSVVPGCSDGIAADPGDAHLSRSKGGKGQRG